MTIEAAIQAKKDALEIKKMEAEIAAETIDVTLPGKKIAQGTTHVPDADQRRNRRSVFGHGLQDCGWVQKWNRTATISKR